MMLQIPVIMLQPRGLFPLFKILLNFLPAKFLGWVRKNQGFRNTVKHKNANFPDPSTNKTAAFCHATSPFSRGPTIYYRASTQFLFYTYKPITYDKSCCHLSFKFKFTVNAKANAKQGYLDCWDIPESFHWMTPEVLRYPILLPTAPSRIRASPDLSNGRYVNWATYSIPERPSASASERTCGELGYCVSDRRQRRSIDR